MFRLSGPADARGRLTGYSAKSSYQTRTHARDSWSCAVPSRRPCRSPSMACDLLYEPPSTTLVRIRTSGRREGPAGRIDTIRGTAMSIATASRTGLTSKLREHFGFRRFRPGQEKVVRSALAGRDTLALMPTGSGKSLCFQLPGAGDGGLDGRDQPADRPDEGPDRVARRRRASDAVAFNSTMSPRERQEAEEVVSRRREGVRLHDARATGQPRVPLAPEAGADRPVRGGRGALRQPLGPRLPPRLPRAGYRDRGAGATRPSWP